MSGKSKPTPPNSKPSDSTGSKNVVQSCPLKEKKLLTAEWSPKEAWCSDTVSLNGTAVNFDPNTKATAQVSYSKGALATLDGNGQNSFALSWQVANLSFKGADAPNQYEVKAILSALGQSAETKELLKVKRVPDKAPAQVSFTRSSGIYGWTASFKLGIEKDTLKVEQVLQIKKAWLGKSITFDPAQDGGLTGTAFVKKDGATWKYWNTASTPKQWAALPRAVTAYTVKNLVFIKSGANFVGRDDASQIWPEAFAEPSNYESKKTDWLANIHSVWENKFILVHKGCKSSSANQCSWKIRVKVEWSDDPGDKLVYAIWAQDWERSNAKDWYLTETRVGVAAHEDGHLFGAYDEYTGGAVDTATNKIEDDSIMGQNLTKGFPRHLDGVRDQAKTLINGLTGRNWEFEIKDA